MTTPRAWMFRNWMPMLALAVVAATAMPVHADDVALPSSAVTDDTTLVIWFDAAHFTPEAVRQAADRINEALPEQMRATAAQLEAQLEEGMAEFGPGHEAFTNAGGRGLLMLMRAAEPDAPTPDPVMLIGVAPGTEPEQLAAAMQDVTDDPAAAELSEYADGWLIPTDELANVPTDGTAENAQAFQQLLGNTEPAPIRMGFRVNESMRAQIAELEEQQHAQGGMGAGNPGAALLAPAQQIEGGWATVTLGEDPAFRPVFRFSDADAAEQFRASWEQLLTMGQQMFMMQFANMPNGPAPESIQGLFDSLQLERDGQELTGNIGSEFITRVGEIAPALEPLLMQMMMGGMGGPGGQGPMGPPPAQQGPQW